MISANDVVIAISYSGESDEIVRILPNIKLIGAKLIDITGNPNSVLAQMSDITQVLPKFDEACHLGFAPTSSTTVALSYGDALAVAASGIYGFKNVDFGKFHPAGSLGKKLILRVKDLMVSNELNAEVPENALLKDAIIELSKKGLGVVSVVNAQRELLGIITDGDLRRQLEKGVNIYNLKLTEVMTATPTVIDSSKLAVEGLNLMKSKNISCLPVLNGKALVGTIRLQDIVNAGIVN